jgi:two-component system response regulator AtoC
MANVLIVGPDKAAADLLRELLALGEHASNHTSTATASLEALDADLCDLVIADLERLGSPELGLLTEITTRWPELPIVVAGAPATVPEVIQAMRAGATDFLLKRFDVDEVAYVVNKALIGASARASEPPRNVPRAGVSLMGETEPMRELRDTLRRAASANATVLIRGESGTGKELVARAVHDASPRKAKPFVKIDCTSLPEALLESELFGYEKGAFTGAVAAKPGRVELADGGTLFLDEIGDVSLGLQAKLLRLLQERTFDRIGSKRPTRVDVRFVLATHRDLDTMVENKDFREDLFHRMNVVQLWLPPLRSRRDDIELLAVHFCARFAAANGRSDVVLLPAALKVLRKQRWPGNVRQLENFIERLVVLADGGAIEATQVERQLVRRPQFVTESTTTKNAIPVSSTPPPLSALDEAVRVTEKETLKQTLLRTGGNRTAAARVLGVSRQTLYNKLKGLDIQP